ncbi:peptidyl-Asp metalloendopeptidase [Vulcaniibacterium thermophilum]|uniref:Peptidyl-Asp metalloendopeptidase n=1 Tax=Vulcaniibacterium thermophilum TaxID=1169913 RepID=A0A919DI35_9GAMM|nr:peptidyl-Asp metalloendopeptidase [Vulcaniibacterium thermophilum]
MKTFRSMRGVLAVGALTLSGAAFAGQPLFVGQVSGSAQAKASAASALAARPTTAQMRLMRANPAVVSAGTREIELDLGGRRVNAVLREAKAIDGGLVWSGTLRETAKSRYMTAREVRDDALNMATLVRRGNGITGSVRMDGKLFRIRPMPDGSHAVIEVDESRMPADHPFDPNRLPQVRMDANPARAGATSATVGPTAISPGPTATIRVMVVATQAAVNAYGGDMRALVDLAVAESNQGYANSDVGINLVLADYMTVNYGEVGMSTDLSRFRGTSDGYMDEVHARRDASGADVMMLVGNDSSACGLASGIGSSASTAFATVYWDCATGYYSFAHEIGHLQSARHDPAADPTNTPYAYGHGYRAPNAAWRTIMAYNCSPSCPRINYWSNPDKTYNGQAMGTADRSHNQRVLVNTKATIAAFRGDPGGGGGGTQTYTNGTDVQIRDNTTVESPITVSGRSGNAPTSTAVAVNIVHTYRGDLVIDLVAPDGSTYRLKNSSGSDSADNVNATYNVNLSSEPINGTWKLRVRDVYSGDTGYINSWSITL